MQNNRNSSSDQMVVAAILVAIGAAVSLGVIIWATVHSWFVCWE